MNSQDPNYFVSIPPPIKAKITRLLTAAHDAAFVGAAHPGDMQQIKDDLHTARYNLERTIQTFLDREVQS